jgi:hypothetical protein
MDSKSPSSTTPEVSKIEKKEIIDYEKLYSETQWLTGC